MSVLIVFSGGVVRVTGSGLGCPTWPACEPGSLTTTPALGIHGLIEFGNRSLTGLLILAVGWAIVAVRLQRPYNRSLGRLAWSQFWLVVANAVAGGISVLTGLNPYVVALHFLLAMALLATTTLTWHRARQDVSSDAVPVRRARVLSWALVIVTMVLIAVGTLVSGSGPHSGDSADVPRMGFVWEQVAIVHGILGTAIIVVAVVLWFALNGSPIARRRVVFFVVVSLVQALVGVIQATTSLPAALVALHLLGSALVWIGALRVLLDTNPGLFSSLRVGEESSASNPVIAR